MIRRNINLLDIVVAVVVVATALYLYFSSAKKTTVDENQSFAPEKVEIIHGTPRLSDGDSLHLQGIKVRLLGIDAPELHQSCNKDGASYPCGELAKQHLESLINGNEIRCTSTKTDKYDRLLAKCYSGERELNREMVKDGWAVSYYDYKQEEADAKKQKLGIWSGTFEWPHTWRRAHPR